MGCFNSLSSLPIYEPPKILLNKIHIDSVDELSKIKDNYYNDLYFNFIISTVSLHNIHKLVKSFKDFSYNVHNDCPLSSLSENNDVYYISISISNGEVTIHDSENESIQKLWNFLASGTLTLDKIAIFVIDDNVLIEYLQQFLLSD